MPISGQTVGRDVSWVINTAEGQLKLSQNFIIDFEAMPEAKLDKFLPVSGIINPLVYHEGYSVKMSVARTDNTLDNFWAALEAAYFAGVDVPAGTIYETIVENNGSVSQYAYLNVQLKIDTFGERKGNDYITVKFSGFAARREILT